MLTEKSGEKLYEWSIKGDAPAKQRKTTDEVEAEKLAETKDAIIKKCKELGGQKNKELMKKQLLRPTKKPDMDNVVKIIADSLNQIAYRDDTQIVDCQCRKFYSDNPRVEVTIKEVKPDVEEK